MAEVEKYAKDLGELSRLIREASKVAQSVCGWPIEQLVESYGSMYERFCPFKIGDRVALKVYPNFEKSPGWRGCQHFLIPGALGTVRDRGYSRGLFTFAVEFDGESWKDDKGTVHPVSSKHVFHFFEDELYSAERDSPSEN